MHSLIRRYASGTFSGERKATTGADFSSKQLFMADQKILLQIWDTAGQERFHQGTLGGAFYRGSHGALLVYDLANLKSFEQCEMWCVCVPCQCQHVVAFSRVSDNCCVSQTRRLNELYSRIDVSPSDFPVVVVANKSDLADSVRWLAVPVFDGLGVGLTGLIFCVRQPTPENAAQRSEVRLLKSTPPTSILFGGRLHHVLCVGSPDFEMVRTTRLWAHRDVCQGRDGRAGGDGGDCHAIAREHAQAVERSRPEQAGQREVGRDVQDQELDLWLQLNKVCPFSATSC
jgi:hypothetical protein